MYACLSIYWDRYSGAIYDNATFKFLSFEGNDRARATFKLEVDHPEYLDLIIQALCRNIGLKANDQLVSRGGGSSQIEEDSPISRSERRLEPLPVFVVQLRGALNDSDVPAVKVDAERHEVSMDWKTMFTSFFTQKLAANKLQKFVSLRFVAAHLILLFHY